MDENADVVILDKLLIVANQQLAEFDASFSLLPSTIREKVKDFLQEVLVISDTTKTRVMFLGVTGAGKTTLLNGLVGKKIGKMDDLSSVHEIIAPFAFGNLIFIDTKGYELDAKKYEKETLDFIARYKPDLFLLCTSQDNVRDKTFQSFLPTFKKIQQNVSKENGKNAPMILVQTKVDNVPTKSKNISLPQHYETSHKNFMDNLTNQTNLNFNDHTYCFVKYFEDVDQFDTYNLDNVMELMTTNVTINSCINLFKLKSVETKRICIAKAIVTRIALLNATISALLPLLDIPLTSFITNTMLKLIASLSLNNNRTIDSYLAEYSTSMTLLNGIRVGVLVSGDLLNLMAPFSYGTTFFVGTALSFGGVMKITYTVGNKAIHYFLKDIN